MSTSKVDPIPPGYEGVTPSLCCKGAAAALDFYAAAFGAELRMKLADPDGVVGHAEITIGRARFMLSDEYPDWGVLSPATIGGNPVKFLLYVPDVDAAVARAVAAGATLARPVEDQFYGDRSGELRDPYGYTWTLATHIEDVSDAEMKKRAGELWNLS
jgi:PhnB protein